MIKDSLIQKLNTLSSRYAEVGGFGQSHHHERSQSLL